MPQYDGSKTSLRIECDIIVAKLNQSYEIPNLTPSIMHSYEPFALKAWQYFLHSCFTEWRRFHTDDYLRFEDKENKYLIFIDARNQILLMPKACNACKYESFKVFHDTLTHSKQKATKSLISTKT